MNTIRFCSILVWFATYLSSTISAQSTVPNNSLQNYNQRKLHRTNILSADGFISKKREEINKVKIYQKQEADIISVIDS
ncbi:MAG: hypothetical protein R3250_06305, partial [Melioribacteraceae bacterium]|nr:hypothetical protein [Melioribacteraceae bacterium]